LALEVVMQDGKGWELMALCQRELLRMGEEASHSSSSTPINFEIISVLGHLVVEHMEGVIENHQQFL
jgi:hypothetical protein